MKKENKRDPICGMQGRIEAHNHYFCSEHCIRKYEKEQRIAKEKKFCPSCEAQPGLPWYKERFYQVLAATLLLLGLSYFYAPLNPLLQSFAMYAAMLWWAILLGLLIGGIIDYLVPREYIASILASGQKRNILYAVLLGFLMTACSHGILAISMALYKKGASTSSVVAFLLASPWANMSITFLLLSLFGLNAFYIIICSVLIAITTGFAYQLLERLGWVETNPVAKMREGFSIRKDMAKRWQKYDWEIPKTILGVLGGSWAVAKMVLWWVLIGMLLASAVNAFVPTRLLQQYLGPSLVGLAFTLLFATVIEVCSEGSSPLAFEIYRQTGAFGNAFVFLNAGVATDYTEIGLVWSNIGRRAALFLPAIAVPQILLLGYLFNLLL